jgi:hypothetical protein
MTKKGGKIRERKSFGDSVSSSLRGSLLEHVVLCPPYMPSQSSFPDFTSNSIPSPSHKKKVVAQGQARKKKKIENSVVWPSWAIHKI